MSTQNFWWRAAQDEILQTARIEGEAKEEHDKAQQIARSVQQEGLDPHWLLRGVG